MSTITTQNWSDFKLRKESWNWFATMSWIVTGTNDPDVAIEAAILHNAPLALNTAMTAGKRWADPWHGPQSFKVFAEFSFGDKGLCASSPLGENPKFRWEPRTDTIPRDIDQSGHAILNSAGDPFNPGGKFFQRSETLIVVKAIPFFNVAIALQYQNSVNSNAFTVVGAGGVDPGQAFCRYFKPTDLYTVIAPYVYVEYAFDFLDGTDPWQFNPIDAGRNGWYNDGSSNLTGPIVDGGGNQPGFDVRLDGTGKPIDSKWKILDKNGVPQTPVANPSLPAGLALNSTLSSSTIKVLTWKDLQANDFSALGI